MARDSLGMFNIAKTHGPAATNAASFTFTFSGDCAGAKVIELRKIIIGTSDPAGSQSQTPFDPFMIVITQTSKTYAFGCDTRGNGFGIDFPDGWDLLASDGDTVTVTLNLASATNSVTRYLQIRAALRGI